MAQLLKENDNTIVYRFYADNLGHDFVAFNTDDIHAVLDAAEKSPTKMACFNLLYSKGSKITDTNFNWKPLIGFFSTTDSQSARNKFIKAVKDYIKTNGL